jgi:hypothetical protein
MQFEVEIYKNELDEWVATAVAYAVTVKAPTEHEALRRLLDALSLHFKTARKKA